MKRNPDTYGLLQWAYYKGEKVIQITERDDGHLNTAAIDVMFSEYDEWSEAEKEAIGYAKGRVLDIGCGAGRHSLYLQGNGFPTSATDISPLAVKICRERGVEKADVLSIEELDFDEGSFDTILMLGGNFSLLGNMNKARRLLKKFHGFTSDEAIIIANSIDPYKTDDQAHIEYHEVNRRAGRLPGQVQVRIRYGIYAGDWLDLLLVSPEEMREVLKGTGWKSMRVINPDDVSYYAIIGKG